MNVLDIWFNKVDSVKELSNKTFYRRGIRVSDGRCAEGVPERSEGMERKRKRFNHTNASIYELFFHLFFGNINYLNYLFPNKRHGGSIIKSRSGTFFVFGNDCILSDMVSLPDFIIS